MNSKNNNDDQEVKNVQKSTKNFQTYCQLYTPINTEKYETIIIPFTNSDGNCL